MGRYLVTGGCGFIGSHLADKLLEHGHEVIVIDNLSTGKRENLSPLAKLIIGDVCDQALIYRTLEGVDGCFHLAALLGISLSEEDWLGTSRINLGGTLNVFNSAAQHLKKNKKTIPVVYASSCAVYGDCQELPLSEEAPSIPLSGYAADKLACELHGKVAKYVHRIPTVGLRFFNVYGPRQDSQSPYSGVISIFVDRIKQGKRIEIFGNGEQTRDFIYVSDVIDHLIFFMDHIEVAPLIANVCTGRAVTINYLIEALERILKKSVEKIYLSKRLGDALYSCGNPNRAIKLGLKAQNSLEEGLKKLLS
jgi:UDP-glucose 4-epimerase